MSSIDNTTTYLTTDSDVGMTSSSPVSSPHFLSPVCSWGSGVKKNNGTAPLQHQDSVTPRRWTNLPSIQICRSGGDEVDEVGDEVGDDGWVDAWFTIVAVLMGPF